MLDYVIPYVEKEFRVIKDKDHRAIMGYSMGGGHSTSIGFGHPELFAYVGAFSGFGSTNLLTADPAKTNKNYKMIFIGAGTEDTAVNGGRTMHDALTKAGVKHMWSEDPGYGHDYQIGGRQLLPPYAADVPRLKTTSGVVSRLVYYQCVREPSGRRCDAPGEQRRSPMRLSDTFDIKVFFRYFLLCAIAFVRRCAHLEPHCSGTPPGPSPRVPVVCSC